MFIFWSEFIIYLGFAAVIGTFVDRFVNFVKEIRYYYLEETGASVDKPTKRILWGFVFSISFSIYIYMNCVIVTTPHNDSVKIPKALSDHPCHQTIEQIVFVDSEGVTLPGEIFCPYVRPYVFPKNHMDVSYIINGDSDNVRYSDYYTQEPNHTYKWIRNRLKWQETNTFPIDCVTDIKNETSLKVLLDAKWTTLFLFEKEGTLALTSKILVVPQEEGQTIDEWKSLCREKAETLTDKDCIAITYAIDGERDMHIHHIAHQKNRLSGPINASEVREMPKMKRKINLRQDLYKSCTYAPVNVIDVKVASLADGGILAKIYFEPPTAKVYTNFIFQYYNKEKKTRHALKTDYRQAEIEPGQDHIEFLVEDGYDQFAFVGFLNKMDSVGIDSSISNNYSKNFFNSVEGYTNLIRKKFFPKHPLNDSFTIINRHTTYSDGAILVDHRVGFWQHIFYLRTSTFNMTTPFIILFLLVMLALALFYK